MNYADTTAAAAVRGDLDLGLTRVSALLCAIGHPERTGFRTGGIIHVAGTNGKGGTTAFLASLIRHVSTTHDNKNKVATFTSPHLLHPSDSWRINGKPVTAADYDAARAYVLARWQSIPKTSNTQTQPTHFELDVAASLWFFGASKCDYAIYEVGVGGRDDATNVFRPNPILPCPCSPSAPQQPPNLLATVITRIGLDHQALLGTSIRSIASHKAGIIAGDGVPCIVGPQTHPEQVHAAVDDEAKRVGCTRVLWVSPNQAGGGLDVGVSDPPSAAPVRVVSLDKLPPNVVGYQIANAATAIAVLAANNLLPSNHQLLEHALERTVWLGRLHHLPISHTLPICRHPEIPVLVDGAHNTDGAKQLSLYIKSLAPVTSTCWIVGLSFGRDPHAMLAALGIQQQDTVICAEFEPVEHMPWVRPVDRSAIAAAAKEMAVSQVYSDEGVQRVWEVKREWVEGAGRVLVAGSLYLVADVYRWLEKEYGRNAVWSQL